MASLNKVMLIGNLTRDPEVRYTPKGSAVCDLGLAVNRRYMTDSGERVDEVTYLDVVLWNKTAELAGQYLSKGRSVFIEGRLQMDTWEDKATGQKRSKVRIVCENLIFLDSKGAAQGQGGHPNSGGGYHPEEEHYSAPPAQPQRRPMQGNGGGGGYSRPAPQRQASPPQRQAPAAEAHHDDFGEGPITDGLDGDDIPF
jgi:single-strand DNA-binding protein